MSYDHLVGLLEELARGGWSAWLDDYCIPSPRVTQPSSKLVALTQWQHIRNSRLTARLPQWSSNKVSLRPWTLLNWSLLGHPSEILSREEQKYEASTPRNLYQNANHREPPVELNSLSSIHSTFQKSCHCTFTENSHTICFTWEQVQLLQCCHMKDWPRQDYQTLEIIPPTCTTIIRELGEYIECWKSS